MTPEQRETVQRMLDNGYTPTEVGNHTSLPLHEILDIRQQLAEDGNDWEQDPIDYLSDDEQEFMRSWENQL